VVAELGPPAFERGCLHVRLPLEPGFDGRGVPQGSDAAGGGATGGPSVGGGEGGSVRGLDILVVHLNAHDAVKREEEANVVAGRVRELTAQGRPAIVMGDFNTLSR